jgi:hypothetical protein
MKVQHITRAAQLPVTKKQTEFVGHKKGISS